MVAFFFPPPGRVSVPVVPTYVTTRTSAADATIFTFNASSIGTAAADRIVCIYPCSDDATSISSVTINGNAATKVGSDDNTNGDAVGCWFYLLVPTGTTADIVITFGSGGFSCACHVYAIYNSSLVPIWNDVDKATPFSLTQTIPAGGAFIAAYSSDGSSGALSGVTTRFDSEIGNDFYTQVGEYASATEVIDHVVTHDGLSVSDQRLCGLIWGPAT